MIGVLDMRLTALAPALTLGGATAQDRFGSDFNARFDGFNVGRVQDQTGFRNTRDGFEILEYVVGRDHWTEGFVSSGEATLGREK
jgi:hypothetical protein